ncbi:MAG TPA: hypothetical protein PLO63_11620 [Syntrophales bacterium]|nr:hypothetical protein [Syntrophales bacterium]
MVDHEEKLVAAEKKIQELEEKIQKLLIENRSLKARMAEVERRVGINPDASFNERVMAEAKRIYAEYGNRPYQRRKYTKKKKGEACPGS